ncbi:MAG: hypothetical protein JKY89_11410 [Immundisolibacteraceae bacterium]|nr:hypothetical protein [Immundisolibacteraceae bacterium]
MNKPVDDMGLPPVLAEMAQAAVEICGDDPHREGVPAKIVALLEDAFKNPETRDAAMGMVKQGMDLFGTNADPGFGIMGVESSKIGYREPHDHGPCWAVNVQVKGRLRMVHWARDSVDEETGDIVISKIDECVLEPGDVDYSPPTVAHELYPLTDDSVELAIRCHSLTTIIQHRYDRSTGEYIHWSWAKKEAVGGGKFEAVGAENEPEPLSSLVKRV